MLLTSSGSLNEILCFSQMTPEAGRNNNNCTEATVALLKHIYYFGKSKK